MGAYAFEGHAIKYLILFRGQREAHCSLSDEKGYIFSGSAVVDVKNTSGIWNFKKPPMVAIVLRIMT
jgi:hypothetical protein